MMIGGGITEASSEIEATGSAPFFGNVSALGEFSVSPFNFNVVLFAVACIY